MALYAYSFTLDSMLFGPYFFEVDLADNDNRDLEATCTALAEIADTVQKLQTTFPMATEEQLQFLSEEQLQEFLQSRVNAAEIETLEWAVVPADVDIRDYQTIRATVTH